MLEAYATGSFSDTLIGECKFDLEERLSASSRLFQHKPNGWKRKIAVLKL